DPADVIADGSILREVHQKYRQLGVNQLSTIGGFDPDEIVLLAALVNEELGWGDSGLAISLSVAGFTRFFTSLTGDVELTERFAAPGSTAIGCWAITEPDHGSDTLCLTEPSFHDPAVRPGCIAHRHGDDYVINGAKAAWVSNGTIADVAALFCSIDGDGGFAKGGVCVVPLDLEGVSRGRPLDKLGQRALPQGEIHFDDVRIPARWMVVDEDAYLPTIENVLAQANAFMGATFAGLARAAYEMALDYARDRVQGGVPIADHPAVRARLFKMFTRVEAARSLARRVASMSSAAGPPPVRYSIASKTFCTTTGFEVASEALQIFGGNGLAREYPIEKLLRDARASMIEDGCNEMLSIVGGARL
ncbi:MAG: acyl-CoA dehydrogenase, partial [Acidimicrobiales bacterium]|nr:acyl-CoA dehydrogenase [Acidimicrobiales bacterium]